MKRRSGFLLSANIFFFFFLKGLAKSAYQKKISFSTKTYVVGTQKNRLNETDPLSTQTYV